MQVDKSQNFYLKQLVVKAETTYIETLHAFLLEKFAMSDVKSISHKISCSVLRRAKLVRRSLPIVDFRMTSISLTTVTHVKHEEKIN